MNLHLFRISHAYLQVQVSLVIMNSRLQNAGGYLERDKRANFVSSIIHVDVDSYLRVA